jgi:predicted ATPase
MKITINNFGPIEYYCFDLEKDIHLIFGENNVGKSYAITIVYLVVKSVLKYSDIVNYPFYRKESLMDITLPDIDDYSDISDTVISNLTTFLDNTLLATLQDSFTATFDSLSNLQNQFTRVPLTICLDTSLLKITIGVKDKNLKISKIEFDKKITLRVIKQNRLYKTNNNEIILYCVKGDKDSLVNHLNVLLWDTFTEFIFEVTTKIKSVHYLPASRSGLYQALSAFGQIIAELSKSRAFLTKKIELPGISEPLSDYFLKLSEVSVNKRNIELNKLDIIAKQIESDILKGTVEFDTKSKRIMYTPDNTSLKLDLSSTSSMVSEISPIVSYLRYVLAQPEPRKLRHYANEKKGIASKPLVIIEEPEAHLHPKVQIKMMSIFAELALNNVKIIITSHSNYIFNKANNLILDKKIDIAKLQASVFKNKNRGSTGDYIETDELGINDENFINVSEELYDEKMTLIDKLNKNV